MNSIASGLHNVKKCVNKVCEKQQEIIEIQNNLLKTYGDTVTPDTPQVSFILSGPYLYTEGGFLFHDNLILGLNMAEMYINTTDNKQEVYHLPADNFIYDLIAFEGKEVKKYLKPSDSIAHMVCLNTSSVNSGANMWTLSAGYELIIKCGNSSLVFDDSYLTNDTKAITFKLTPGPNYEIKQAVGRIPYNGTPAYFDGKY